MGTYRDPIQKLYIAYFGRPADAAGLQFWEQVAESQGNVKGVSQAFANSAEFAGLTAGMTYQQKIHQVFNNLYNHNCTESEGVMTFWSFSYPVNLIVDDVALKNYNSADYTALHYKTWAANAWVDKLTTQQLKDGYSGDAANAIARDWLHKVVDYGTAVTAGQTLWSTLNAAVAAHNATMSMSDMDMALVMAAFGDDDNLAEAIDVHAGAEQDAGIELVGVTHHQFGDGMLA
jgi:hypothetical protein